MILAKESGIEIVPGITIPWEWVDGIICGLIEKGDANLLTEPVVEKLDSALESVVQNTKFLFDNVGKAKLLKALTLSMVKKYTPELLPNP